MKKIKLLKSLLISTLGIISFGSLGSIISCGNNNTSFDKFCVVEVQENSKLTFHQDANAMNGDWPNLQYAKYIKGNDIKWEEFPRNEPITLESDSKYLFKGNNPDGWDIYDEAKRKWQQNANLLFEGDVSLSGTINALIDNGAGEKDITLPSRCFSSLFIRSSGITSVDENFLPSTNLGEMCYNGLFRECTSLIEAPDLPATILQHACYAYMFNGCSSLSKIKIMYADTYDKAPKRAFFEWVNGVASTGSFYYNGSSHASAFGDALASWHQIKF